MLGYVDLLGWLRAHVYTHDPQVVPMLDRRLLLPVAVRHYVGADSVSVTAPDPHPTETRDPVRKR